MNLLAIETATTVCAIGVARGDEIVTVVLDRERRHTEVLTSGVSALLAQLELTVNDLDRIVVDRGPGLFTGLRVGLATAQALAHARGIDLVTVSSLELLAHGAWRRGVRGRTWALVDARRGELFGQRFELADEVVALDEPRVTTAQELAIIWATSGDPVTVTGDGAARYRELIALASNVTVDDELIPSLQAALVLGAQREPTAQAVPLYLREADAVANFTTRQRPVGSP